MMSTLFPRARAWARGRALVLPALLLLAILAPACSDDDSSTPTNPTGIPNVAGAWSGAYRIKTCTETFAGTTGQTCPGLVGTATRQPIRFTLQQTDNQLVGNLELSGWYVRTLLVTGTIDRNGQIILRGSASTGEPLCPTVTNRITLNFWASTLNRTLDGQVGEFGILGSKRVGATGCVFSDITIEADTLDVTKS
jgi:hypothetical protein